MQNEYFSSSLFIPFSWPKLEWKMHSAPSTIAHKQMNSDVFQCSRELNPGAALMLQALVLAATASCASILLASGLRVLFGSNVSSGGTLRQIHLALLSHTG